MLDRYWSGPTSRISPEAPVPVVKVEHNEERPGGAANVALNVAALGGKASLLGLTGQDEAVIASSIFLFTGIERAGIRATQIAADSTGH